MGDVEVNYGEVDHERGDLGYKKTFPSFATV